MSLEHPQVRVLGGLGWGLDTGTWMQTPCWSTVSLLVFRGLSSLIRRVSVLSTYCILGATPGPEIHNKQPRPDLGLKEV